MCERGTRHITLRSAQPSGVDMGLARKHARGLRQLPPAAHHRVAGRQHLPLSALLCHCGSFRGGDRTASYSGEPRASGNCVGAPRAQLTRDRAARGRRESRPRPSPARARAPPPRELRCLSYHYITVLLSVVLIHQLTICGSAIQNASSHPVFPPGTPDVPVFKYDNAAAYRYSTRTVQSVL